MTGTNPPVKPAGLIEGSGEPDGFSSEFDVVIVGTGAGGAVVGAGLAERGFKVALVEEGSYHPPATHRDLGGAAVARLYRNQGLTLTTGNCVFPVVQGRAVGGTTVVNSGTCFRVKPGVLRHWREEVGLTELTEDALRPHFERVEKAIHVEDASYDVMSRANTIVRDVFTKQGVTGHPLKRNIIGCEGCGWCCYGCSSGAKQSMEASYLPRAWKAGARVFSQARAEKIMSVREGRGRAATGVRGRWLEGDGGISSRRFEIRAKRVIVAAGTIHTPILLARSGFKASPKLGRHLTVHPATKVYAEFDEDIQGWFGTPQAYTIDALEEDGVLFEGVFLPPELAAGMSPFIGPKAHEFMRAYRHMATFGFMIEDSSTGRVIDLPWIGPVIFYNLTENDVERMKKATLFLAEKFLRGGAKRVVPMVRGQVKEIRSEADLRAYAEAPVHPRDVEAAAFHPLGTARMAPDARNGVVDVHGAVHGARNLYVCDGSIMPTALGVNPQVTIMALADRLAEHLAQTS